MIVIMSEELFERLSRGGAREQRFLPGASLFRRGDAVRALHLVREGEVHLVRDTSEGRRLVLQRALAGSVLAEASLLATAYHCDALAVPPTCTLRLPVEALRASLTADASLATAWSAHLAREVQMPRARAEILTLRTVEARLDAWLATGAGHLPAKGAWRSLAAEIGVTSEALCREIARRRRTSAAAGGGRA